MLMAAYRLIVSSLISEKVYSCTRGVDGDTVLFEVLDTAAQQNERCVEENIRWADAYILLYSVADRCSLNECLRLKFLINAYGKRNRKLSVTSPEVALSNNPVALVGNQNDRNLDRMVPLQEGVACAAQLGCVAFYEISVRECCDSVHTIFEDLYLCHKRPKKFRAVYPRRSVSVCKFPSACAPEGEETEEETCDANCVTSVNGEAHGVGVGGTAHEALDGSCQRGLSSVQPAETANVRRRGALQSIS
nr:hypothetical protein BaRGS_018791 [Batillaria attramentaria]